MRELNIEGAFVSEYQVHGDSRGLFREWYKKSDFLDRGLEFDIQQANFSQSSKGVLRGIHYSIAPLGQSKLVTCSFGNIMDVLIDLRIDSPTFLQVAYINLEADSGNSLFIPSGIGHSFLVMSDQASVVYLTSSEYDPNFEHSLNPFDSEVGITWPEIQNGMISLSERDSNAPSLSSLMQNGLLPQYNSVGRTSTE